MRMRFTKEERQSFMVGAAVQWRNGRHWHPGVVIGEIDTLERRHSISIRHVGRSTATLAHGQQVTVGPTAVRLPAADEGSVWGCAPSESRWYGELIGERPDGETDYVDGYSARTDRPNPRLLKPEGWRVLEVKVGMTPGHPRWRPRRRDDD